MRNYKINKVDNYPIIVTPKYFTNVSNELLKFEEYYPNVKKPIFTPDTPQKKEEVNLLGCGCFILILWLAVGLPAVIISNILNVSSLDYQTYWFPWVLGIFVVLLIISILTYYKTSEFAHNKEQNDVNTKNIKNRETFLKELKEYEALEKQFKNKEFQNKEILKRLKIQISSKKDWIFRSLIILKDKDVKKGISEELFYKYLNKYTDFKVYKSIKCSYYYPDLIIIKDDIVIDLEIDEPYAFDTKEPIHFEKSDASRDDFFLKNDYVLLRFTENQIIDNPKICVDIIQDVFRSCITLEKLDLTNYSIIQTNLLTYEQSFDLAYNNSRSTIPSKIAALEVQYGI